MARGTSARVPGALLALCLLLASAVALEIQYPESLVMLVGTPADGTSVAPGTGVGGAAEDGRYQPPGETDFQVIELRPLFDPDRRPLEAGAETAQDGQAPPASLDGLVLTGIIGAGAERVAIVEPAGPPRPGSEALSLRVGEELRGWTVEAIGEDHILLVNGPQRFEMELTDDPARRRHPKRRAPSAGTGSARTPNLLAPQPQTNR